MGRILTVFLVNCQGVTRNCLKSPAVRSGIEGERLKASQAIRKQSTQSRFERAKANLTASVRVMID